MKIVVAEDLTLRLTEQDLEVLTVWTKGLGSTYLKQLALPPWDECVEDLCINVFVLEDPWYISSWAPGSKVKVQLSLGEQTIFSTIFSSDYALRVFLSMHSPSDLENLIEVLPKEELFEFINDTLAKRGYW